MPAAPTVLVRVFTFDVSFDLTMTTTPRLLMCRMRNLTAVRRRPPQIGQ
ncbi:hypothetical protein [Streptomyces sp. NPDC002853]